MNIRVGTNYVRKLLNHAESLGYTFIVHSGGDEPDYKGPHPASAEDAIIAVDEAYVYFYEGITSVGMVFIVNGLAEDERIADSSGNEWIETWWKENVL